MLLLLRAAAALAVLWLALAPEKFPLQADTFSRAAGTAEKQKWSLILPSSARVSELTYVTMIGTRYPELDTLQNDVIQFGNYFQAEQCTRGGFLPIFWVLHTAILTPAQTLERWWTGSRASSCQRRPCSTPQPQ